MVKKSNMILAEGADISENNLVEQYPSVLEALLFDHTTRKNIFWATDNYAVKGAGYGYHDQITKLLITGDNGKVIMPRVKKDKGLQSARVKNMAEVFTPSWVCNAQNNLIDTAWFGREGVFNIEVINAAGQHTWQTTTDRIVFPEGRDWKDYVSANRLEITCGEAPYITSRYDTTTGEFIPVQNRIGLLDRKLRVISENVEQSTPWLEYVQKAYQSIYAYEWQGDSLLLAREAMLYTFIENYFLKFHRMPQMKSIRYIAYIISWNVWQMDGLKYVVPDSCHETKPDDLFGNSKSEPCPGCRSGNNHEHNGIYCLIKDWTAREPETKKRGKKVQYQSLPGGRHV